MSYFNSFKYCYLSLHVLPGKCQLPAIIPPACTCIQTHIHTRTYTHSYATSLLLTHAHTPLSPWETDAVADCVGSSSVIVSRLGRTCQRPPLGGSNKLSFAPASQKDIQTWVRGFFDAMYGQKLSNSSAFHFWALKKNLCRYGQPV